MKKYVISAVMIALNVAISLTIIIPLPGTNGFVSLIDAGIITAALLFGPQVGFIIGGLSAAMLDMMAGYVHWVIPSLIIHGLQGWIVGYFYKDSKIKKILALILSSIIMVIGYALAAGILYSWPAAISDLIPNIFQVVIGMMIGYPLHIILKRATPKIKNNEI